MVTPPSVLGSLEYCAGATIDPHLYAILLLSIWLRPPGLGISVLKESMLFTVLVVEDFQPFRQLLCALLQNNPQIQSIAEIGDGRQAVDKARELQPDLILLDIGLPGLNGIEAALRIRRHSPLSKLIFVSSECSVDVVKEAFDAGALGYLVKTDAARELGVAIETVLSGKSFVSATFSGKDLTSDADLPQPHS